MARRPHDSGNGPGSGDGASSADGSYSEAVLRVVESVPAGRVTTYGAIADVVGGGPRQVGALMALDGGAVPWWRVVRADGSLPGHLADEARRHHHDEGTPLRPSGRVDLVAAFWEPSRVRESNRPGGSDGRSRGEPT